MERMFAAACRIVSGVWAFVDSPFVVAQQKHERLRDTLRDDFADGRPVDVDAGLAARIVMAE
jgi:hypothetical protein